MLSVGIATGDMASAAQLLAHLEQTGCVKSIKQWSIPAEKLTDAAESLPDVVFLDLARDSESYFAFGSQLRRIRPSIKLVACSSSAAPTQQLLLEAMRSGVQDFLTKPVSLAPLKEILLRFMQEPETRNREPLEKVVVVMGSKGGVGTTTVAVNLGVQLASHTQKRVVLLDFARPLGNVHLLLDLHAKFGIRDAVESLDRLDSHFFSGLLTHHKTKLEILGGAMQAEEWQNIAVPPLERIVNVAQSNFDIVLVDIGSQFSSEWSQVLRTARMILLVAETNVPALWTLERRLLALKGFGIDPERARVIINRWHKGDDETLKSIQKSISRPVFACLPNDFRKASEAANLGTPILQNHSNALSNSYRQIAYRVAGINVNATTKKSPLGGLFSFPTKG